MEASQRTSSVAPHTVHAEVMGDTAFRELSGVGASGVVTAVVSHAVYLACDTVDEGPMLWIVPRGSELHPRAVVAVLGDHGLRAGARFDVRGTALSISGDAVVDFGAAARWAPTAIDEADVPPLGVAQSRIARGLEAFAAMAAEEPSDGFGGAIGIVRDLLVTGSVARPPTTSWWLTLATPPIIQIARACLTQDVATVVREADELLGLGPGLTPSGDDFVGGMLFAATVLHGAYPRSCGWDERGLTGIADRSRGSVNPISHALLVDHAHGMSTAAAHDVLRALVGGDETGARSAARRLTYVGHTSGWDILAGMMTGMLLAWGNE